MHKAAIERSKVSLTKATESLKRIEAAQTFDDFESAWSDFLFATNRIFTQLEQGAKNSNKSFGWFAKHKGQRRSDPLLSYMWHARNADEHGLEQTTSRKPGGWSISGAGHYKITGREGGPLVIGPNVPLDMQIHHLAGEPPKITIKGPSAELVAVKMRDGGIIQPPQAHLGSPLADRSPTAVAKLYHAYVEAMLGEAGSL